MPKDCQQTNQLRFNDDNLLPDLAIFSTTKLIDIFALLNKIVYKDLVFFRRS